MSVIPPRVRPGWDDNSVMTQAELLAFSQIRDMEDTELAGLRAGV